jgi:HAMP domain-containing protein/HPt (histidine-containing phosphotransfer) domain-containing protein
MGTQSSVGRTGIRRPRLTIGLKLGLLIGGLQVAIIVFLAVFFHYSQLNTARATLRAKAATYARLVSQQVRSSVAFDDQETAREVFESIASDAELQSAALYTENGRELRSWGNLGPVARKANLGLDEAQVFELGDRFLAVSPVVSLEGPKGTLTLELSKHLLLKEADQTRIKALALGGAALMCGLLLSVWIARSFAGRLKAIATVAERVAAGDLEQNSVHDPARDEIGSLAQSFNTMLSRLKALIAEIQHNAELEQQRLEGLVQVRTQELAVRNDDMRRVLENVEQGFLTIDRQGQMSIERSRIIEKWLGASPKSGSLWDYIGAALPGTRDQMVLSWDQVVEGFFPLELSLGQMPSRFVIDGRHLSVEYKPILDSHGDLERVLVVMSDLTAVVERERVARGEQEITNVFTRLLTDRNAVVDFLTESDALLEGIVDPKVDVVTVRRLVHTLKGNASLYGLGSIAELCHDIESAMAETQGGVSKQQARELAEKWQQISTKVQSLLGDGEQSNLQVSVADYDELLGAFGDGTSRQELRAMLEAWRLEPTEVRLTRLAEQALALAARLDKGPIEVVVDGNKVRLEGQRWAAFWSAVPHLLRNAIDHGLESPEERSHLGKQEPPRVSMRTSLTEHHLIFEVYDNGRGIQWDAIRKAAQRKGLECTTDQQLLDALFSDGVSTREHVSEYSGRGVGMAALRSAALALGGTCEVHSGSGKGTCIRMKWPATLASGPVTQPKTERRYSIAVGA